MKETLASEAPSTTASFVEPINAVIPDSEFDPSAPILAEVVRMAQAIEAWRVQQTPALRIAALVKRFKDGLESDRTYGRFIKGETASYKKTAADWLAKYRTVYHQVQMDIFAGSGPELYDDLSSSINVATAVTELVKQTGNTRIVVVEGNTGAGKTEALRSVQRKLPGSVMVTADPSWKKLGGACRAIAIALGITTQETADDELPPSTAGKLARIYAKLKGERVLLMIDEAHEMTGEVLNLIKGLINNTNCVIVISAMDTLWKKLQANSWQEAKQLVFNRLFRRVRLEGPDLQDAQMWFLRRAGLSLAQEAFANVVDKAKARGLFAFLRRVSDHLTKSADRDAAALDNAITAASKEISTERGNRN